MIINEKFKIQPKDIGKKNYVKNRGILEILEDIAIHHSDMVGYGPNDIEKTNISWILIDWKVQILKRPKYGQILNVNTWGRTIKGEIKRTYTYRDFEVYDENDNLCIIGTSKWAIVNARTGRLERLKEEIIGKYEIEDKDVFKIGELDKIKIPENFSDEITYKVRRRDIDLNNHMHNLYYLDLAYEVLPQEVYEQRPFDNFRISYKKEVKYGDVIKCRYTFQNDEHVVTICNEDGSRVNAIVTLK